MTMISEAHPHYKILSSSKMRGKSYSPRSKTCIENHPGEPRLSGELNSGRTNYSSSSSSRDGYKKKHEEKSNEAPPPQHKKQVRRRLHNTRPYQERILNMAEARREIVAALKFHRNARKQNGEKKRRQEGGGLGIEGQTFGPLAHQLSENYLQGYCSPYPWPVSPVPPPQLVHENLNFVLPSQTLGLNLNLNLEDFNCLDNDAFHCRKKPCSIFSSSSSSSPLSATTDEIPCMGVPVSAAAEPEVNQSGDWVSHHAMDDKELAEIKSIGEQHQMEWNDALNLVNSAWWFKFSNTIEIERNDDGKCEDLFDEVMEFPAWLNARDENCSEHVNGFCPEYDFPALPCMDFSMIEGMDGDWLA